MYLMMCDQLYLQYLSPMKHSVWYICFFGHRELGTSFPCRKSQKPKGSFYVFAGRVRNLRVPARHLGTLKEILIDVRNVSWRSLLAPILMSRVVVIVSSPVKAT